MRACGADREKLIAAPGEEHGLIVDMAVQHRSVRNRGELHAETEIRSFKLHIVGAHFILRSKSRRAILRAHRPPFDAKQDRRVPACGRGSAALR